MEDNNFRSSSLNQRPKKNYFDTEIKGKKYNGAEKNNLLNDDDKSNYFSARNIFGSKKKVNDNKSRNSSNSKK